MKRKYWYICTVFECPVCGCGKSYRERVYEKPNQYWHFKQHYDWCDAF